MGQIIGSAAKPMRCNLNKLSQLGILSAGEYVLIATDSSMNAAGQGNFDAYIEGNGTSDATELPIKYINGTDFFEMFGGEMEVKAGDDGSAVPFSFPISLAAGYYELICTKGTVVSTSSTPTLSVLYKDGTTQNFNANNTFGQKRWIYFDREVSNIVYKCQVTTIGTLILSVKPLKKTPEIITLSLNTMAMLPWSFFNGETLIPSFTPKQDHYKVESRISTLEKYSYNEDVTIKVASGYRYYLYYFNSAGTYTSANGWNTGETTIKAGQLFGLQISTIADNAYVSPDIIESAITISKADVSSVQKFTIAGAGSTGKKVLLPLGKLAKFVIKNPWPVTNVGVGGNNVLSVGYNIGSTTIDMQAFALTEIQRDGFPKEFFVKTPDFPVDSFQLFIRCDSGSNAEVEVYPYMAGESLDVDTLYKGNHIDVKKQKFAMTELFRLATFGTPTTNINAQGMATYDNRYIIQGSNKVGTGSHLVILDTYAKTYNIITYETLTSGQGFHMNNVNIGEKYDATDTLPLLYCSEFYNAHSCKVLRIANDFSAFTLIQTISYVGNIIEQNYDWVVDIDRGQIHALQPTTGGIYVYSFNLPSASGGDVTFGDADIVETHAIPNPSGKVILSQGGTIIGGKLWMVYGMDRSDYPAWVAIVDIDNNAIVSTFDLTNYGEPEAVDVYEDGVLFCIADGMTSGNLANPAYVYALFNV